MHIRTLGGCAGFALQLCAGAATVIWPDQKWIALVIFASGSVLLVSSVCWWFFANYRLRWPIAARSRDADIVKYKDKAEEITARPSFAPSSPILIPDWPIHDLFYYLRPDIHPDGPTEVWDEVGEEVLDKLSTGQLGIWGRQLRRNQQPKYGPLEPIKPEWWSNARFDFVFLLEKRERNKHAEHPGTDSKYCDLQVSRAQAMAMWPQALVENTEGPHHS